MFNRLNILVLTVILGVSAGSATAKSLDFIVENNTFGYNIEHTNIDTVNEGQTHIGDIIKPYFRYNIQENMFIDAGALLNIPFGEDGKVQTADPVISFLYDLKPGWRIVAGTINQKHPLLDAIFNDDRIYTDPVEQGFQFMGNSKNARQDLWISWEEKERADRREKFSIGDYTQLKGAGFMVDAQVYWVHFGGQRNAGGGTDNQLSYAFGAGYSIQPRKFQRKLWFLDEAGFDIHYIYAKRDPSENSADPRTREDGMLYKVFAKVLDTEFHYLIWEGGNLDFRTAKGDPLYKADRYREIGVQKNFWLADGIALTFGVKGQFVLDRFVHEDLIGVKWQGDFPLLEDYFHNLSERAPKSDAYSRSKRIASKNYSK
ncbi:MAG: hypothetical protein HY579_01795 [Nitrospinae bacterium]|nr:hypothetical protein [Nitrospinota bacterium]